MAHEDDALRAVRAATEMRAALPELGVRARIGVNTGPVVTGTAERIATGDAVNVAARLEQAAQAGEIVIGAATLELIRAAVDVENMEPLQLKGKAEPVPAWRLLEQSRRAAPVTGTGPPACRGRRRRGRAERNHQLLSGRACPDLDARGGSPQTMSRSPRTPRNRAGRQGEPARQSRPSPHAPRELPAGSNSHLNGEGDSRRVRTDVV